MGVSSSTKAIVAGLLGLGTGAALAGPDGGEVEIFVFGRSSSEFDVTVHAPDGGVLSRRRSDSIPLDLEGAGGFIATGWPPGVVARSVRCTVRNDDGGVAICAAVLPVDLARPNVAVQVTPDGTCRAALAPKLLTDLLDQQRVTKKQPPREKRDPPAVGDFPPYEPPWINVLPPPPRHGR